MTMQKLASVLRKGAAVMQKQFDDGKRPSSIDLHDLTEVLLTVADEIDPDELPQVDQVARDPSNR